MDPQVVFDNLMAVLRDPEADVFDPGIVAEPLLEWLDKQGFVPEISSENLATLIRLAVI